LASPLFTSFHFLLHRLKSQDAHDLHSPFLFDLYNKVFRSIDRQEEAGLLALRKFFENKERIEFLDPKSNEAKASTVASLKNQVASSHRFSYFLVRLIKHLGYDRILETGTSIGLNAAYLGSVEGLKIWTIEGSIELAACASRNFRALSIDSINVVQGLVQEVFGSTLEEAAPKIIFLDADHRSETIRFYLETIKSKAKNVDCIVIHDIYWSPDMLNAWKEIVANADYLLTIDVFEAGIIFPNYPMEKQHFTIRL
jgi:predicted O-methyltransferase YrrM